MKPSRLIYDLRKEKRVSQADLARGLISLADLSRFENGEKELSYPTIEAMVQRLGKSCDKFEIQLNTQEYNILFLRQQMLHNLRGKQELFDRLCEAYEELDETEHSLHEQYLWMMKGCAAYLMHFDTKEATKLLLFALEATFPEWNTSSWMPFLLSTQEIQIALLLAYCALENNQAEFAENLLEHLSEKITKDVTDEEEYARLYPQWCYLKTEQMIRQNDINSVRYYIKEGKKCISENGLLTLAVEFLDYEMRYGEEPETAKRERDAFFCAAELAGVLQEEDTFMQFILINQHRELLLVNELIRDTRQHKKISQEELSWEVCAAETLSRIESGKRKPHRRSCLKLYEKLGLNEVSYQVMETDDFTLLEMDRSLSGLISMGEYTEAEKVFQKIREKLDQSVFVNRQYIEHIQILLNVENGTLSYPDAILRLGEIISQSMNSSGNVIYRTPSRNEFSILAQIGMYHIHLKQFEKAKDIFEGLLAQYQKSKVTEEHHAREYMVIYIDISIALYSMKLYGEGTGYLLRGIHLAFQTRRGDLLAIMLRNYAAGIINRKTDSRENGILMANASYWLFTFFGFEKMALQTKEAFRLDNV